MSWERIFDLDPQAKSPNQRSCLPFRLANKVRDMRKQLAPQKTHSPENIAGLHQIKDVESNAPVIGVPTGNIVGDETHRSSGHSAYLSAHQFL